jgi:hypothetical protein
VEPSGHAQTLDHLHHHHPGQPFAWGSGRHPRTADLALSILADAMVANTLGTNLTGVYSRAMRLSVPFEWVLRGNIGWLDNWEITRREVLDWVHEHEPAANAA